MNSFALTDDQIMLADNLNRLLRDANEFSRRRARLSGASPDRLALWPAFAEQGVIAAAFDESRGGFSGDPRTVAVVMAELGAALAVEPYLATAVVAGRLIGRWIDRAAGQQLIDEIIAGERIVLLAHNPHLNPSADPPLRVAGADGAADLNGTIPALRHADVARSFIVPVSAPGNSVRFYHIDRDHPGLGIESFRLIDGSGAATLHFNGATLPESACLSVDGAGDEVLKEALEWGIFGVAAEAAGIIGALNSTTFAYLGTRKQFGTPLAGFQALQHRAADMWIAAEELLAVVELAVEAMSAADAGRRASIMSIAKIVADGAGRKVGNESVQLHGGMGVSDELIVSHYFRRLAAIRGEWGSEDAHRLTIRSV